MKMNKKMIAIVLLLCAVFLVNAEQMPLLFSSTGNYQIQVGAFLYAQNMHNAYNLLRNNHFTVVLENFQNLTRVIVTDIYEDEIPIAIEKLKKLGFNDFIIRQDTRNRSLVSRQNGDSAQIPNGEYFLHQNASRQGVIVTASGLQYEVIVQGSGVRPGPSDRVRIHTKGSFIDGFVFDSTHIQGRADVLALDMVISGLNEGLQLMRVGSTYRFLIPANLAFGSGGMGIIPPNSTLIYEIELLEIIEGDIIEENCPVYFNETSRDRLKIEWQIAELSEAIQLNPNDPSLYVDRAFAYLGIEEGYLSIADLETALRLNPRDQDVSSFLSFLRMIW